MRQSRPRHNPVWRPTIRSNSLETGSWALKRILIADDHESVLRRVRGMLESHPEWEVCGDAVTGRQTVARAAELKPDLVVLDFAMPQMDGLKAAEAIKNLLPKTPIVMFTMYCSAVTSEAERHGICRVIDKAKSGALLTAIEEVFATEDKELLNPQQAAPASPPATKIQMNRAS
jgi:DNA-binding NarL/FixJ family response regulator